MTVPMISVVMPVYNAEKYVAEAVESILNQTYSDFEFIIIDDCSTDSSYKILQSYAAKDNRIRLFKNEMNHKQAYTKNLAIELAQGKYIAFMDADDISLPERFAKQIEFMESNPTIGVSGTYSIAFDSNNSNLYTIEVPLTHELIKAYSFFVCCKMIHPSIIARRELFAKIGRFSFNESLGGLAEDYALWIDMLYKGVIFANLQNALLKYRLSSSQTTNVLKPQIEIFTSELIKKNLKQLFGCRYSSQIQEKHIFYIQGASFFKLLLNYIGFLFYKKQFIDANRLTKVLNIKEVDMFMNNIDPVSKLFRIAKHSANKILHKFNVRSLRC